MSLEHVKYGCHGASIIVRKPAAFANGMVEKQPWNR